MGSFVIHNRRLSPIGYLPTEILLEIFAYALRPEDQGSIIKLSSVCDIWRRTISQESALFTHADWRRWPTWLLRSWTSRAQTRLLTVEVDERIEQRFDDVSGDLEFQALLFETASKWGAFYVAMRPVVPQPSTTSARSLSGDAWSRCIPSLRLSSSLTHLTIILGDRRCVGPRDGQNLFLPTLVSLTVVEEQGLSLVILAFRAIISSCSFPNVRTVKIHGLHGAYPGRRLRVFFEELVSTYTFYSLRHASIPVPQDAMRASH